MSVCPLQHPSACLYTIVHCKKPTRKQKQQPRNAANRNFFLSFSLGFALRGTRWNIGFIPAKGVVLGVFGLPDDNIELFY